MQPFIIPVDTILKDLKVNPEPFEIFRTPTYNSDMVKTFASRLAGDLSTYDNMRAAGRMLLFNLNSLCGDVVEYLNVMEHRLNKPTLSFLTTHSEKIQENINFNLEDDYRYHDLFSASTLIKTYMMKPTVDEDSFETPQQMYWRIAIQTYFDRDYDRVLRCKTNLSKGYYTAASPTIFNSGTKNHQLASCFLIKIGDNIRSILETGVYHSGLISSGNGGLGIDVSEIRHSQIGDVGNSSGVVPAARVYDKCIKYVDQGGKRDGAGTAFLKLHHIDVQPFIEATNNYSDHTQRFFTMNTCLWTSRYFFEKVEKGEPWYVFCPAKAPRLNQTFGFEYETAYEEAVIAAKHQELLYQECQKKLHNLKRMKMENPSDSKIKEEFISTLKEIVQLRRKRVEHRVFEKAGDLLDIIVKNQVAASTPYIMHGDACNWKNNQKHLGSIDSSNLCVTGDTLILTSEGMHPIESLVGRNVKVWNGTEFSEVVPKQTSKSARIYRVGTTSGLTLDCTAEHKFLLNNEKGEIKNQERVSTKDLKLGDQLLSYRIPVAMGGIDNTYLSGSLYKHRKEWIQDFIKTQGKRFGEFSEEYFVIPYSKQIQLTLLTLGVASTLSSDGKDLFIPINESLYSSEPDVKMFPGKVNLILDTGREEPTYCFTEPFNHAGVFGGILTGQCLEIIEKATPEKIASCNLGSHNVPRLVVHPLSHENYKEELKTAYDWDTFSVMARDLVEDIDARIDKNKYPLDEYDENGKLVKRGNISLLNLEMRPLGIGVSGFSDAIMKMDMLYDGEEAEYFNKVYFACKYFNELCQSIALASQKGSYPGLTKGSFQVYMGMSNGKPTYQTLNGAPFYHGILQFDLWREEAQMLQDRGKLYSGYDRNDDLPISPSAWNQKPFTFKDACDVEYTILPHWSDLKRALMKYGIRNSMLGAIMPTASTANIFRNAESTEPYQANVFSRDVVSGSYLITNRHLEDDLTAIGCWSENILKFIIICQGSVKHLVDYVEDHPDEFPSAFEDGILKTSIRTRLEYLVLKYKTTFEISQKHIIKMARQRGIYVDQSQSLNIHLEDPKEIQLKALHSFTLKMGLKTGMYYLRQSPTTFIGNFTADLAQVEYLKQLETRLKIVSKGEACRLVDGKPEPGCLSCQ